MDIQRIIRTFGIRAVAHRTGDAWSVDHNPSDINPALLRGALDMRDVAGEDVGLVLERRPSPLRIVAQLHGDTLVVVAVDQGDPICKSLPRLLRKCARRSFSGPAVAPAFTPPHAQVEPRQLGVGEPASAWVPPGASEPEPNSGDAP